MLCIPMKVAGRVVAWVRCMLLGPDCDATAAISILRVLVSLSKSHYPQLRVRCPPFVPPCRHALRPPVTFAQTTHPIHTEIEFSLSSSCHIVHHPLHPVTPSSLSTTSTPNVGQQVKLPGAVDPARLSQASNGINNRGRRGGVPVFGSREKSVTTACPSRRVSLQTLV